MRFSIIVPVYNVASCLRDCLGSIAVAIEQCVECRVADVEVICVDDGSMDGSSEILDELSAAYHSSLIVYHSPANAGVSAARNKGLQIASGEWLLFVDADDVVSHDWLEVVNRVIEEVDNVDIVRWGMQEFVDSTSFEDVGPNQISVFELGDTLGGSAFTWNFWRQAYRRTIVEGLRFPPYVIGEDLVYSYAASFRAIKIAIIDKSLYGYRVRTGSAMNSKMSARKVRDLLDYNYDLLSMEGNRRFEKSMRRMIVNQMSEGFWYHWFGLAADERRYLSELWLKKGSMINTIRSRIACLFRSSMIAFLLFALPRYLKTKGFHR